MNIIDKIKTYEDACTAEGVDPVTSLPYPEPKNEDEEAINAVAKVFRLNRVLNEGWKPDWNNYEERKYYPWFDMETYEDQVGSGVGFSYYDYDFVNALTYVGSRLCFRSSELAKYAGTQFLEIYKAFMTYNK